MSLVRIHNFSISLDGFGTGEGQSLDTPFGHAGERLHEWMFPTRWWSREMLGQRVIRAIHPAERREVPRGQQPTGHAPSVP